MNAKSALSISAEDSPDLTKEEILIQQKELMESFSKKKKTPVAGRGRGRGGRGKGRKITLTTPRQSRSSRIRIEEITEDSPIGLSERIHLTHQEDQVEEQLVTRRKKVTAEK
jgi:hypothetical protein